MLFPFFKRNVLVFSVLSDSISVIIVSVVSSSSSVTAPIETTSPSSSTIVSSGETAPTGVSTNNKTAINNETITEILNAFFILISPPCITYILFYHLDKI